MSHVLNESRHTFECVKPSCMRARGTRMNESRHTYWMSHVTPVEYVTSHIFNESHHRYECAIPSRLRGHGTRMNESSHTYWMSHVTYIKRVSLQIWMRNAQLYQVSWHTHESVTPHMVQRTATEVTSHSSNVHRRMSHATHSTVHGMSHATHITMHYPNVSRQINCLTHITVSQGTCDVMHSAVHSDMPSGHISQFPLKMLHPRNPPNRETQIPRYLAVQTPRFLVWFEFVPRNLSF